MNRRGVIQLLAFLSGGAAGIAVSRRYRRFAVSGQSMLPTLQANDWVIVDENAYRSRLPKRGHIVVARDPRQPERLLIKRVTAVDLHGDIQIEGDNAAASTDSRDFGPVSAEAVVGRVRWRYWPPSRAGTVR